MKVVLDVNVWISGLKNFSIFTLLKDEAKSETIAIWQKFTEKYSHNPQGWHYYARYFSQIGENQAAMEAMWQANH